jgi:hypothetical protein
MAYLQNSIIDFTNRINAGTYSIEDYFTFDTRKVYEFIEACDSSDKLDYFDWYQMQNDDKLERISLELYKNADYWDILLLINQKDPLFNMPYNFNTVSNMAEDKAIKYAEKINNQTTLPQEHIDYLIATYQNEFEIQNELYRPLRIVKPNKMQEFIRRAYDNGCFV